MGNIFKAVVEAAEQAADRADHAIARVTGPVVRALTGRPFSSGIKQARYAKQRIARGWDDTATWSLDTHLCSTLGAQLAHLADTTHGYPSGGTYTTFEKWQEDLRLHAANLTAYGRDKFNYDDDIDQEALQKNAQESLRWVADNLGALWD